MGGAEPPDPALTSGVRRHLDELAAAFRCRAEASGKPAAWAADRAMISTAHRVLFHLGILDTPPADPRRRTGLSGRCNDVTEPLRTVFGDYCTQAAATRAAATVKAIAGHLADFGRFLSACDPPVTDLALLDRATVEAWLAALAAARLRSGNPMSIGYRRGRIIAVRQFLTDITEWGWPAAPARILIFSRDLPRLEHPLPRYLPPDVDRALLAVLTDLSGSAPAGLTRLHADALLLTRATGIRIGELRDLELDCVHQVDGHGAWLKVPLGKLASERMVPLDEETVAVVDRIVARRTPGRPLPHQRTGAPVDFLLVHQGRRISACALREELARAADIAWKDTPTVRSRLAGGFCLRAPAQGACSYANICEHCPNFRTDTGYLAVLAAQHTDTLALAADAEARGWGAEAQRHRRLADRLDELINQTGAETP